MLPESPIRTVSVILPLAIRDTYLYLLPDSIDTPAVGCRVLVPLSSKTITGIVYKVHTDTPPPENIQVRAVIEVLDAEPIVLESQLRLWEWIAEYYLCTLGEVMTAALPTRLIDNDYIARKEVYISLHPRFTDLEQLQPVFDALKKAPKQRKLLETFLEESGALEGEAHPITRRLLVEYSGQSTAILRTLVEKQIFCEAEEEVSRLAPYTANIEPPHPLSAQQAAAAEAIRGSWEGKRVCLLHGVTSSGKTEVYIQLIQERLDRNEQVLYLVPEIALTTQLTERLRRIFGNRLLVYHSRFSDMERAEIYRRLINEQGGVVVLAARSGVFLPLNNLKLVIIDEEHDASYKQQDPAPRYHARSVAIMMAAMQDAAVLLGTATPSIESFYNAQQGKYSLVTLTSRYADIELPKITIVDLQRQYHRKEMYLHFSDPLVEHINTCLDKGKQTIIFQNRRGFAPYLACKSCGYVPKCVNCDVSLTYHKFTGDLSCHYCNYTIPQPRVCPVCGGELRDHGLGTEKVESEVASLFPKARVKRMDRDTTRLRNGHLKLINAVAAHEVDILVGTQMVTKGLHFDEVALVAVLNADSLMNIPDYRSTEHAFQALEQVAGRAGRKGSRGEVIIQTFHPDHPMFSHLVQHDYLSFYKEQLEERQQFRFPPFYRLISLTLKHRDLTRLLTATRLLQERLKQVFGERCSTVIVPAISRIQNMHIRSIRLRFEQNAPMKRAKERLKEQILFVQAQTDCKGTIIQPDVD